MNHRLASLNISELPDGRFFLSGYAQGKQIRIKRAALSEVEELKRNLEAKDQTTRTARELSKTVQYTVLTAEQLRDAEAAYRLLEGRRHSLLQCVNAAKAILGEGGTKDCAEAMEEFLAEQKQMHLSARTLRNNRGTVELFLSGQKPKTLEEISPAMIRKFAFAEGLSPYGQIGRLRPVVTWLNWCVSAPRKYLGRNPCDIDVTQLADAVARSEARRDRIITPEQCQALLEAAVHYHPPGRPELTGRYVPFTVLSLYCFMRSAEVCRTTSEDIHLDNRSSVDIWGKKRGGKFRVVTIPANVKPLLQDCADRGLLAKGAKIPYDWKHWEDIRENAGLIKREKIPGTRQHTIVNSLWQANVLRHTGESYHYAKGGDITDTARQAGHSSDMAFKHYLQLAVPEAAEKFYGIRVRFPAKMEGAA